MISVIFELDSSLFENYGPNLLWQRVISYFNRLFQFGRIYDDFYEQIFTNDFMRIPWVLPFRRIYEF